MPDYTDLPADVADSLEANGIDEDEYLAWCREEGLDPGEHDHAFDFWISHGMDEW